MLVATLVLVGRLIAPSAAMPDPTSLAAALQTICHAGAPDDPAQKPVHDHAPGHEECLLCPTCHLIAQVGVGFVLPSLACGCTGHGSEAHRADLAKWVGISETELVRRLGRPDASSGDVSQKFLVYSNVDARYVSPSAGYHYDQDCHYGFGRAPAIAEFNCKTTFVIENGRVRAYDLSGCD